MAKDFNEEIWRFWSSNQSRGILSDHFGLNEKQARILREDMITKKGKKERKKKLPEFQGVQVGITLVAEREYLRPCAEDSAVVSICYKFNVPG